MTTTQTTCPKCGGRLLAGDRFCAHCGATQEETFGAPLMEEAASSAWDGVLEHLRSATGSKYEIGRALGFGGMAAVFLARELKLNRRVAIKVMSPSLMLASGMIERFHREAVTVAALNHPNIVTIYTVEETDKLQYFVMKYVPGPSIESVISKDGPLPISVVKVWLTQVASALGYAHRRGVVHRDIKPANILLDDEGNAIVTDFGIAKVAREPSLTQVGATVGTPPYMSPEQCQSKDVTAASDQYSLGIVLYEMLTGEPPFTGPSLEVMQAHVQARPRPILVARPDCPAALQAAVFRMLAKNPSERWPAMEDVIAAVGGPPLAHDDPIRSLLAELAGAPKTESLTPVPGKPPVSDATPERLDVLEIPSAPGVVGWARRFWWVAPSLVGGIAGVWLLWRLLIGPTPVSVASVAVKPTAASIPVGGLVGLEATVQGMDGRVLADRPVGWTSSDSSVANVKSDGVVNGVRSGEATVTAAVGGKTGAAVVTVIKPVNARDSAVISVDVMPRQVRVSVDRTFALRVVARDGRGDVVRRSVEWTSSDRAVAAVSSTGVVSGVGPGTATVTARSDGVRSAPAVVTVVPAGPPAPAILEMAIVPWAYVSINGLPRGQRTRGVDTLPPRVHRVHFEREGFVTFDTTLTLRPGERLRLTHQMRPRTP